MMFELLFLNELIMGPQYGYQLKIKLKKLKPNNNKIYPLLQRFTEEGFVTKTEKIQSGRPNKIMYSITEKGREYFIDKLCNYSESIVHDPEEFYIRVVYFPMLPKDVISNILELRENALKAEGDISNLVNTTDNNLFLSIFRNTELVAFLQKRIYLEIDFIQELRNIYLLSE